MACRSGCPTPGEHESYGECARSAGIAVSATVSSLHRATYDNTNRELKAYREARADGIQPEGTTMKKISAAKEATRMLGRPYNAEKDPPASMISTKAAAKYVNGVAK